MTEELTLIRVKRKVTDDPEKGIQFSAKKVLIELNNISTKNFKFGPRNKKKHLTILIFGIPNSHFLPCPMNCSDAFFFE